MIEIHIYFLFDHCFSSVIESPFSFNLMAVKACPGNALVRREESPPPYLSENMTLSSSTHKNVYLRATHAHSPCAFPCIVFIFFGLFFTSEQGDTYSSKRSKLNQVPFFVAI